MKSKRVLLLIKFYLALLTIVFILGYFLFKSILNFNSLHNLLSLFIFILIYLIFFNCLLKIKKSFLFLDNLLVEPIKNISGLEDPLVEEIVKEITIEEPNEKKFKYYGSTDSKTYHFESCRFSGTIKEKYLVKKNTPDYFKKNKFKPCGTCKPNRKK